MPYNRTAMPHRISTHTEPGTPGWGSIALLAAAAGLAASMVYVHAKKREAEQANPAQGQVIEVDGVRLHYLERGEGLPLVLLHGNGLHSDDFALSGLLDAAAASHRVIVFDRPGFGHSERPGDTSWTPEAQARLIYKALRALGAERPVIVGHSWGALVTLALALNYPRYVRAMTLVSGYYYPTMRLDAPLAAVPALPLLGHVLRNTLAPLLGRLMWPALARRMFGPAPVPERFAHFPAWMSLRPAQLGASAAESGMLMSAAARLSQRYGELRLPIAVLAGCDDQLVSAEAHAVRFHKDVPHSDLQLEEGCGHMLHYAHPDAIMAAVARLEVGARAGYAHIASWAQQDTGATLH
ncbi:alpha/beta fold hydrolase [Massilia genomosp. 1]|uniref:Alpha/beta fold hydrolase n=1 Tax=Massilia genomosp. 1 TaxID=2609280 RepID=A0ABX0MZP9_9BURK|nr:alpha/beta hydrolase [Massilia genomosp. 1]NHZ64744.1 alpha/beta fold hydrolase [Massilia genomosp. 1]